MSTQQPGIYIASLLLAKKQATAAQAGDNKLSGWLSISSNHSHPNSSNLLYPKEDRATNQLMFTCRTCHVGEPATSYCVYQNKLHSQVGDTAGVTQDVGSDPTVRDSHCFLYPMQRCPYLWL
jgi:hypothetical protein